MDAGSSRRLQRSGPRAGGLRLEVDADACGRSARSWSTVLATIFRDPFLAATSRSRDDDRDPGRLAADDPLVLTDLLLDSDEKQFLVLFPKVDERSGREPADDQGGNRPTTPGPLRQRRTARNAGEAPGERRSRGWCGWGRPEKVWPLLRHSPDYACEAC